MNRRQTSSTDYLNRARQEAVRQKCSAGPAHQSRHIGHGAYQRGAYPVPDNYPGGASGRVPIQKKRLRTWQKALIGVACVLFALVAGIGIAGTMYVTSIDKALTFDDLKELEELKGELTPVESSSDPFYVLLLGSDARGDEASRSDVNILVRVDPDTAQVTMVSIPRDTKVEIDGYGTQKINAAYAFGGASLAVRTMSEFAGVPIAHYAEIHFDELVQLIDKLGGVTVDVPEYIDDPNAGNVVIPEGEQTLNGTEALVFARSRSYADGDFTRTSNQRLLVTAILEKVMATPALELPGTIQSLAECVTTDYSVGDLVSLALQMQSKGDLKVYSGMVPSTTDYIDGVSYVITTEPAWSEMMAAINAGEDPADMTTTDVATADEGEAAEGDSGE